MKQVVYTSVVALCLILTRLAPAEEAPRLETKNGRHALLVNGSPFLVLGAQINNSSSWAASLPQVWPALAAMHANTVAAPVYWEQMEPQPGKFDFSTVDLLLNGAREHQLHLIVLWFGTWKNGNMHYVPQWVKTDTKKYPRVINAAGEPIDVLSANARANLEADKAAFTALMRHVATVDATQHTLIMVQVENESGNVGSPRDFSPSSNREFEGQVPADLLRATGKTRGTWREVFGGKADETFQVYHQARYVNEVAARANVSSIFPFTAMCGSATRSLSFRSGKCLIPASDIPRAVPCRI